jgi:hypothetical protein
MKLKTWIGPLIAVIILFSLRQMIDNKTRNEQQRSNIPAAIMKQRMEINPPMTATRALIDTLPL